jgi:uncharacterized protein (TIGR02391 family)
MALPDPTTAVALPIDELGLLILRHLDEGERQGQQRVHRGNVTNLSAYYDNFGSGPSVQSVQAMVEAFAEAYDWLTVNGLVAVKPGETSGWGFITRRGRAVLEDTDQSHALAALRAERRLDLDLHPLIARAARRQFLLGEYELAVFAALKEVEVRVRSLAGASPKDIGVPLMTAAFKPGGPLADSAQEGGEQEATMALFRGAIGVFKNPTSHRPVEYSDPTLAAEAVMLADLLMRMLDDVERRLAS